MIGMYMNIHLGVHGWIWRGRRHSLPVPLLKQKGTVYDVIVNVIDCTKDQKKWGRVDNQIC